MIGLVVHTTGVNWQGVLANVASLTIILGAAGALVTRSVKRSTREQITAVIEEKVSPQLTLITRELREHDTRIARLEGVDEGKRQALQAARTSSVT